MSIKHLGSQLRVECDGRTPHGPCENHHVLDNSQESMKAASEYLERRGWRSLVDGYVQLHLCRFCSQRDRRFNVQRAPRDVAQSGKAYN